MYYLGTANDLASYILTVSKETSENSLVYTLNLAALWFGFVLKDNLYTFVSLFPDISSIQIKISYCRSATKL